MITHSMSDGHNAKRERSVSGRQIARALVEIDYHGKSFGLSGILRSWSIVSSSGEAVSADHAPGSPVSVISATDGYP
jgi:hypothetical protein